MQIELNGEKLRRYSLGTLVAVTSILAPIAISGCSDQGPEADQAVEFQRYDPSGVSDPASHGEIDCPVEALSDNPYGC